ncbi:hypothetical protein V501_00400 [Pseudogymnoascus sp. VKM F-4519 (FW-2642)]|nr:hypothetical protein V501_00400 [Pseudogymnoascus sp. VKM F-4519 (FW-2642)]
MASKRKAVDEILGQVLKIPTHAGSSTEGLDCGPPSDGTYHGETSQANNALQKVAIDIPNTTSQQYHVYRVQGLPLYIDTKQAGDLISALFRQEGNEFIPQFRSFAHAIDGCTTVATISFQTIPMELLGVRKNEWSYDISNFLRTLQDEDEDNWRIQRRQILTIDDHFDGPTVLSSPLPSDHEVDCLAISGLGGHAFGSFKEKDGSYMWLCDDLPYHLATARIIIYGYESQLHGSQSFQGLEALASNLRALLRDITEKKPLFFIAHSLGGLIVKEAIIQIRDESHNGFDTLNLIYGALFFGVPNQGIDITSLIPMVKSQFNQSFLHSLSTMSDLLLKQCREFPQAFNFPESRIMCFYETLASPTAININGRWRMKGPNAILVGQASATHSRSWENKAHHIQAINRDHSQLVKFRANDEAYRRILGTLKEFTKQASTMKRGRKIEPEEFPGRQACLNALYFDQYKERRLGVSQPHPGTLTWIWDHPQYQQWEESSSSNLLWLQGKPGSGKSTLANHIQSQLTSRLLHIRDVQCLIVDFFYSARGGGDQQGHIWMLRSILYQILLQAPALWEDYYQAFNSYKKSQEWTLPLLLQIFVSLGIKYDQNIRLRIHIIIDAMDESEEDMRHKIVSMLYEAGNQGSNANVVFKILVASRPNLKINFALRNCRYMKLEDQTRNDIIEYVCCEIRRIAKEVVQCSLEELDFVSRTLIFRSRGVFLWVKLVLAELEERAMEGLCTTAEIENLTTSIPTDLEELYFKIVEKIEKRDQAAVRECQTILRWVAYSPEPLDVEQMREILAVSLCGNSSLSGAQIARHRVRHVEELRRRITNRCGNLLEIRRGVVQFVHQTAREYILRETKSDVIQLGETASRIEIGRFCKRYLDYINFTIEEVWKSTNLSRNGVGWASADLENYVDGITNRQPVLADFCLDIYRLHAEQYSFLSVELDEVVQDFLAAVESTYQLLEGATLACIINGDDESLKKLIRAPEQVNRLILVPGDLENIDHFVAGSFPRSSTTRHWSLLQFAVCLKVGADYTIKALLRLGADPNFRDETGQTPLFQAVERGSSLLSYTLVSTTMKCSFDDADGCDPESRGLTSEDSEDSEDLKSEYYEDESAVHKLVQAVAATEWNSDENGFVSPDKLSRRRRKSQILSADPMVTDHTGKSPLSMALKNHNYELARGLLVRAQRRGFVTAESEGLNIHNYLYETCRTGNTRAFDVLADFTDNWNFYDNDRRTLMHVAAANGHQEIVSRLLLRPCLDLEWKDREGQTALEVAVLKQHHTVTNILEKKGYN